MCKISGGHRDNPDAIQFRAAYRQVVVDLLFFPAKNKNCLEDLDTTILRLSNLSQQAEDSSVSRENENTGSLTPPSSAPGLLHVANSFAAVTAGRRTLSRIQQGTW